MDVSAKHAYLVTYDVADPKRLLATFKVMKNYGDHLQLSVFRCDLSARQFIEMKQALLDAINCNEDQVLLVDLGPADGETITSLGRVYKKTGRRAIVI